MGQTSFFRPLLRRHVAGAPSERQRADGTRCLRKPALAGIGAAFVASLASPAIAATEPSTKVVGCAEHSCLKISGRRDSPAEEVSINGHVVPVEGGRSWWVVLPVETVRRWSAPHARTIEVALRDPETNLQIEDSVDLPIGLLGGITNLAALVVSVR